jgi:hypothetical protein
MSGSGPTRWPAYATDCRFPIDRQEALRLIREYLNPSDELPEGWTRSVDEWEICFTSKVLPSAPPMGPDGIPIRPVEPGSGVTIIDKETGHFSFWPSLATSYAVEQYMQAKSSGEIEYLSEWPEPDK